MRKWNVTIDYDTNNGCMLEIEAETKTEAISEALSQEGLCRYILCEEV